MNLKQSLATQFLIIAMVMSCIFATGCSQEALAKAVNYSAQVESQTDTAITAFNLAVGDELVTSEQAGAIVPKLETFRSGVSAFKTAAIELKKEFGKDVPRSRMDTLNAMFDEKVTTPFLELLKEMKVLKNVTKFYAAIAVVRYVMLNVSQALGKSETVSELKTYDSDFKDFKDTEFKYDFAYS